jgi:hypothetical protein
MIADISGRIYYVNLLMDSGIVLGFNAFHIVLVNPNSLDVRLPVDTDENLKHNNDSYEAVYRETVREFQAIKSRIREVEDMEMIDLVMAHFLPG